MENVIQTNKDYRNVVSFFLIGCLQIRRRWNTIKFHIGSSDVTKLLPIMSNHEKKGFKLGTKGRNNKVNQDEQAEDLDLSD